MNKQNILFFIGRHGTTQLNESENFRGWSNGPDAHLDKKGIRQAHAMGRFLSRQKVNFGVIVSSDLDRATHTAAIVAKILGVKDIRIDKRLRPLNVGDFAGKPKDENPIDYFVQNPSEPFPGGESIEDFDARQKEFADDFLPEVKENPDEYFLVIAHVSNVMYWDNLHRKNEEYLDEKTDLVTPGGVVLVTKDEKVIPLFRENPKVEEK